MIGHHERAEIIEYDKRSGSFVPSLGGIAAFGVEFSRDGKWMTYSDSGALIWRSKSDGSEAMQLTFPPMGAEVPHWSPDGERIAFAALAPGKASKLWLISRDGGTPQQLTESDDGFADVEPTWSPDGNTLAFGTYVVRPPGPEFNQATRSQNTQVFEAARFRRHKLKHGKKDDFTMRAGEYRERDYDTFMTLAELC